MKRIIIALFISAIFFLFCFAQNGNLVFDSKSGNYIIRYQAHFVFVKSQSGLRPYDKDQGLKEGEELFEKDSLVEIIFEPATKIQPRLTSTLLRDNQSNALTYSYTLGNGISSKQRLNHFILEFGEDADIINVTPADGWHSMRENRIEESALMPGNRWHWFGDIGLKQGKSWLVGALKSSKLPGIVNSYFQGKTKTDVISFPDEGPEYELRKKIADLEVFPANHVHAKTIAPLGFSENIASLTVLDTLLSNTRQSVELGWLGTRRDDDCDEDERPDEGITKNIDKRLEKAKKELSKGDSTKARKELEKLVDKVERTWKRSQDEETKHKGEQRQRKEDVIMTSEAYALLKYNTEYLIDRLPSEKKKKSKK